MQYTFDYENSSDVKILTHEAALTLDEVKSFIDQLLNNLDLNNVKENNLDIIANLLGYPIDKENDPDFRRRSLKNAIDLYKSKGTEDSIKILFYNLGFNVSVVPLWTADYIDFVKLVPPYLKGLIPLSVNNYKPGYYDVTVFNPDNQLDTKSSSYQYL